ncbi:hypothetical protein D3C75_1320080 [compost metagenome]
MNAAKQNSKPMDGVPLNTWLRSNESRLMPLSPPVLRMAKSSVRIARYSAITTTDSTRADRSILR